MKTKELITPAVEDTELHAETLCSIFSGTICQQDVNAQQDGSEEEILF